MTVDHYAVLGVATDADRETIRTAYVAIARATHPDRASGDAAARASASRRIREANAAWNVLGDPARRAEYDRLRRGITEPIRSATTAPRTRVVTQRSATTSDLGHSSTGASWFLWAMVAGLLLAVVVVLVVSAYATAGDRSSTPSSSTVVAPSVGGCVAITASAAGKLASVVPCSSLSSGRVVAIVESPRPCPTGAPVELADGRTTLCLAATG